MPESFEYAPPTVDLEIHGVAVTLALGDVEMVEALDGAVEKLLAADDENMDWRCLSDSLRGCIRSLMGDEAFEEAFGGRPANVIEEIECLAYARKRIREATEGNGALVDAVKRLVAQE